MRSDETPKMAAIDEIRRLEIRREAVARRTAAAWPEATRERARARLAVLDAALRAARREI
jgi:hypothetical protein